MVYIYICLCFWWWVGCVAIHNHDWLQCIVHWGCDGFVPREQSLLPRENTARTSCAGLLEPDRKEDLEDVYIYMQISMNIHGYPWWLPDCSWLSQMVTHLGLRILLGFITPGWSSVVWNATHQGQCNKSHMIGEKRVCSQAFRVWKLRQPDCDNINSNDI